LPFAVEIEDGVTIKDVLEHLNRHADHVNLVFCGYLGDAKLEDFVNEARLEPELDFKETIDLVEFCWNTELEPAEDDEYIGEFNIINTQTMRGITQVEAEESDLEIDYDEDFDLSLVALRNYANEKIEINPYIEYAVIEEMSEPVPNILMDGEMAWTLFDFISTLLNEISYYGTPEDQKIIRDGMIAGQEEMDNAEIVIEHPELIAYLDGLSKKISD
jgi:hypothetical protein